MDFIDVPGRYPPLWPQTVEEEHHPDGTVTVHVPVPTPAELRAFEAAIRANPTDARLRADFAFALHKADQRSEGIDQLFEAVRLAPGNHRYRSELAAALGEAGRLDEAVEAYDAALHLLADSDSPVIEYEEAMLRCGLSEAYVLKGEADQAKHQLQLAVVMLELGADTQRACREMLPHVRTRLHEHFSEL